MSFQGSSLSVADIDKAIAAAVAGKSYTLPDGQSVTRQNLTDLYAARREQQQIEQLSKANGSMLSPIGFRDDS